MSQLINDATRDSLDFRLNCYGNFDSFDPVCNGGCALAINCAMEKAQIMSVQSTDDRPLPGPGSRPRYEKG